MSATGPVFVVGCPRSGTSALSWALAAHPDYWTSVETHFFYYLLRDNWLGNAFSGGSSAGSWLDVHAVSNDEFLAHAGIGFDRLMRSRSCGLNWVDSSPENLMVASPLLRMFPDGQLFHVVRNPQSVCLSMLSSGFAEPWARDLGAAIDTWKHYVSTGMRLGREFPNQVMQLRQEDMRSAAAETADAIGRRLGLEDVEPIAGFLAHEKINSSFDKSSYSDVSPFRDVAAPRLDPDEFHASHGARIWEETSMLASQCGYVWA
jgi:Sulfotransferase family